MWGVWGESGDGGQLAAIEGKPPLYLPKGGIGKRNRFNLKQSEFIIDKSFLKFVEIPDVMKVNKTYNQKA